MRQSCVFNAEYAAKEYELRESPSRRNVIYAIRKINSENANSTRGQMIRRVACMRSFAHTPPSSVQSFTLRQHEQMLLSELHTREYALLDRYN